MLKKQRGLTMISWIVVIGLVGIQAVMAVRIIPIYMNFNSVQHIMDGIPSDPKMSKLTKQALLKNLKKKLKINGLYDLSRNKDAFKFAKDKTGNKLVVHYEERGAILGNLEFVVTFDHEVTLIRKN